VGSGERSTIQLSRGAISYSTDEVTAAKVINLAKKNASAYCRGGNIVKANAGIFAINTTSKVICVNGSVIIN
jgi:hypothetical protein